MQSLLIHSASGDYPVDFIEKTQDVVAAVESIPNRLILMDQRIATGFRRELLPLLGWDMMSVRVSEEAKTLAGIGGVIDWLIAEKANRNTTLVAIGGGVIQDIATFTAHTYHRGIKWVFLPTTLLSQCDSCIGAKAGINHAGIKNQLGVFHSPSRVIVCPTLRTGITHDNTRSGFGEILKLALTGGWFGRLKSTMGTDERFAYCFPELPEIIRECLVTKQAIIEEDEFERGRRVLLNYGHTFGHALEAITSIPHGLAVAWGIDCVNYISWKRGWLHQESFLEIHDFIKKYLKHDMKISVFELFEHAKRDKKGWDGMVNLVVLKSIETNEVSLTAPPGAVKPTSGVVNSLSTERVTWNELEPIVKEYVEGEYAVHRG